MSTSRSIPPLQVGLVADEPIRLAGMISIFEDLPHNGHAVLIPITGSLDQLLSGSPLDFLVLDLHASPDVMQTVSLIHRTSPEVRVIVIGPDGNDELVLAAITAGARGYLDLSAEPETVRAAILAINEGSIWAPRRLLSKLIDRLLHGRDTAFTSPYLTAREREVLDLILMARSNREIASQLGIEERTVKAHVGRLLRKTGVENRIELSMRALNLAILPDPKAEKRRHYQIGLNVN